MVLQSIWPREHQSRSREKPKDRFDSSGFKMYYCLAMALNITSSHRSRQHLPVLTPAHASSLTLPHLVMFAATHQLDVDWRPIAAQ